MVLLIGTAEIQLQNLTFPYSRDKIPAAVERLAAIFTENCDPIALQNQIPVYVQPGELQQILTQSHANIADIRRGQHPYPRLKPPSKVRALHGRQRYEAALQCLGPQTWWAIRIYCIADGNTPETLLHDEMTEFSQQTPYSDGEIFRRVYTYQRTGQWKRANEWLLRLSKNKQTCLRSLCSSGIMCEKLYELTIYPGLCDGLELGNISKHLAEHCFEEIGNYLDHIRDIWGKITLNNREVQQAADIVTVEALQRLAPSHGYNDQEGVKNLMRSGILFDRITNPALRRDIELQLLNIRVVIPSIKTFHENMSYLKVGMRILREHLLGRLGRMAAGETVAKLMRSIWRPGASLIEYAEDRFYPSSSRPSFYVAYHIIFISALRNFPKLSLERPNKESGQVHINAGVDERCLERFLRHAQTLGFTSSTIESKLCQLRRNTPPPSPLGEFTSNTAEFNVKRRSGCPWTRSYNVIARHLFLPEMLKEAEISGYPSIIFVQTDFMRSFFREFPNDLGVIARDTPGTDASQSRRSITPTHAQSAPGTLPHASTPPTSSPPRQMSPAWETAHTSNEAFHLAPSALSAALSAQERRQLQHQDSESLRSVLSPPDPVAQRDSGSRSLSPVAGDDAPTSTHQTSRPRDTLNSIGSQDTQSSASTGRTILAPHGIREYRSFK